MIPSVADPTRPVSAITGRRPASDLDKPYDCACKNAAQRRQQITGKGKEADTEEHGKEGNANGAKKLKRYKGVAIDINKVPHHDDSEVESPPAAGSNRSALQRAVSSLENMKKELEFDARRLKLEQKRAKWAFASKRKDMELEKMQLENDRMKLVNNLQRVKIKRMALELGIELDMI